MQSYELLLAWAWHLIEVTLVTMNVIMLILHEVIWVPQLGRR